MDHHTNVISRNGQDSGVGFAAGVPALGWFPGQRMPVDRPLARNGEIKRQRDRQRGILPDR